MSQSLERGLTVLKELGGGARTLDQLADQLGVHKSTALRLLRTLESNRFVRREGAHHYRLGSALFDLSHQALEELDVRTAVRPFLVELGETTGHTVHLATCADAQVVYIDKVDSRQPVRMYSRIGKSAPLHCTGVGKVLAADLPEQQRRKLSESLDYPKLATNTITTAADYLAELDRVRQQGYAVDRREHEDFIHCVAAPVRDDRGEAVAAMSLSVPEMLLDFDGLLGLVDTLLRAAGRASTELGHPGARPSHRRET